MSDTIRESVNRERRFSKDAESVDGPSNRDCHGETLGERVGRITVGAADVPPQIRVGDEPITERFNPARGKGGVMPPEGLFTTSLGRRGPLWHLHLPRDSDAKRWWRVVPQSGVRVARIDGPTDLDVLCSDSPDPHTHLWGEIAEVVDAVWLTERGHEQLCAAEDTERESWTSRSYTEEQGQRYAAFEMWASGCVLWLNWCFETIELYRHARDESLYISPFTYSKDSMCIRNR